jgi:two-component system, chemotaxis family, protein-glutamate methylesterase/glutaminase
VSTTGLAAHSISTRFTHSQTERAATRLVVIGSSTGGPLALQRLLAELPADFPAAILIAQHMPAGFTKSLAVQLDRHCSLPVREAIDGEVLSPGVALVVPGDFHARVTSSRHIKLDQSEKVAGHRPSIDVSMLSAAAAFGQRTCAVLLTGMGSDGADGMTAVRANSGRTFAQEGSSCVVNGMPQRAIDRGVVDHIGLPEEIAHGVIVWSREQATTNRNIHDENRLLATFARRHNPLGSS